MVTPTAIKALQPTAVRMMKPTTSKMAGFMYRENRVPFYQRLFQRHDGKRQWWKTGRSPFMIYPYYVMLWGSFGASTYMMCRQVLGHKTWFGKD